VYEARAGSIERDLQDLVITHREEVGYRRAMAVGVGGAVVSSIGAIIAAVLH
jgi:hypothetical protein